MLLARLDAAGAKVRDRSANVREIACQYFNLTGRLIPRRPRHVIRSREFRCPQERLTGLRLIEHKMSSGGDLNPHLTTRLEKTWLNDGLLSHWDIQHFHLGECMTQSGFVVRTAELLFARVTADAAYLLDVRDHGSFSDQELFQALQSNWPETLDICRLSRLVALPVDPSGLDVAKLRAAGINSISQADDSHFYMPLGGGVTTSGVSVEVVELATRILVHLPRLEDAARARVAEIVALAAQRNVELQPPIRLRLDLQDDDVWAAEDRSKVRILVGCLS